MRSRWMDKLDSLRINLETLPPDQFWHLYRGCAGKVSYPSKRKAMGVRRSMVQKSTDVYEYEDAESLEAYKCVTCGRFHLGHSSRKKRR